MIAQGAILDLDQTFTVVQQGEKSKLTLRELITRPTLISVYMKNNTSACDKQIISLVEQTEELTNLGIQLVGLSKDTAASHLKYAAAKGICFPLISDPDKHFAEMTDSLVEKSMYGKKYLAPSRSAYLIQPDGTVTDIIETVDAPRHAEQVKALLTDKL